MMTFAGTCPWPQVCSGANWFGLEIIMDKKTAVHKIQHNTERTIHTFQFIVFAILCGLLIGVIGALFHECIDYVTGLRTAHPQLLLLLPFGAVLILFLYRRTGRGAEGGTNLIISSIQSNETVPLRMAPLIFIATTISHLVGASVGREGAALQLGGSIGHYIASVFRFSDRDRKTLIMTGMSAAFSAMFGTPLAAAVFPMEVVSVGIMQYSSLLPCTIASFVAHGVAVKMGAASPFYELGKIPSLGIVSGMNVLVLALLSGFLSWIFCAALQAGEHITEHFLKNPYVRALVLGSVLLIYTWLSRGQVYNGAGSSMIMSFVAGEGSKLAFLFKMVFTILSICAGYKGGEIVPSFFIGAAFGRLFGALSGFSPSLSAAVGMGAVFCGVTNSPISSFIICCEMFGFEGSAYFLLACVISYVVSGYYGLYTSQKIMYSKFRLSYIDKRTL